MEERGRVGKGGGVGWGDNRLTAVEDAERRGGGAAGEGGAVTERREREGRSGGIKRGWRQMR